MNPAPTTLEPERAAERPDLETARTFIDLVEVPEDRPGSLSTGELADLRRIDPEAPRGATFWRLCARHLPESLSPERERQWGALLQGMASMRGLHQKGRRLGEAMFAAHVSESRLTRLLRASGPALRQAMRSVARQLVSAGQPVDWLDFARLLLDEGDAAETIRRRIAGNYYSQQNKEETTP